MPETLPSTFNRQEYGKKHYRLNRERILARSRRRYFSKKEQIQVKFLEWKRNNLEKFKARTQRATAKYKLKYPGRCAENCKRHFQRNRAKMLADKRAYSKKRYNVDRDKILAAGRRYQLANKEKIRAQQKGHRITNATKRAQVNKAWRDRSAAWIRNYHKANPHIQVMAAAKRRALKRGAAVDIVSIKDWMARIKSSPAFRCYYCKRTFSTMDVHFDHVLPLTRFRIHKIGNLCASCPACNLSKSDKLPSEWTKHSQSIFDI